MYTSQIPASRLPENWKLPKRWGEWALVERQDFTADHVRAMAKRFRDYHHDHKSEKSDWELVWKNWVRRQDRSLLDVSDKNSWWKTASGIEAKGVELGVEYEPKEIFPWYKLRVFAAAGAGPWNEQKNGGIKNV